MIDAGETDWKVICIDTNDTNCDKYNDITDVPSQTMDLIDDFLTNYKVAEGKGQNKFADKKIWTKDETVDIVVNGHKHWSKLVLNRSGVLKDVAKVRPDVLKSVKKIKLLSECVYSVTDYKN